MHHLTASLLIVTAASSLALTTPLLAGCTPKRKVKVIWIGGADARSGAGVPDQETLRERYAAAKKARENAPEPKLNPNDPREKFQLVWRMGGDKLNSIYGERADMIAQLGRMELHDRQTKKIVKAWIPKLTRFGIGRSPKDMAAAPKEICALITAVRAPAEALIDKGEKQLKKIQAKVDALDAKAESGAQIPQWKWNRIEKARTRWSGPALAGKELLLVVKSILQEAYVLADLGPRRAQRALCACLVPIAKTPLKLDLAQRQLEKVIARCKWYRDLR